VNAVLRNMIVSAVLLGLFAVIAAALLAWTHDATAPRIAENQRQAVLRQLHALVPATSHDNDLFADVTHVRAPARLGGDEPLPVYRARRGGRPVAAVLTAVAPDGYNGTIRLLVAVRHDGTLLGVRVVDHRETPGLGDAIDERKSDWILGFAGKSLRDPPPEQWRVKRDGGVFDQFTGATITPRAVVAAVRRALEYYQHHRDELFAAPAATEDSVHP